MVLLVLFSAWLCVFSQLFLWLSVVVVLCCNVPVFFCFCASFLDRVVIYVQLLVFDNLGQLFVSSSLCDKNNKKKGMKRKSKNIEKC
jgi:hypothetical protein